MRRIWYVLGLTVSAAAEVVISPQVSSLLAGQTRLFLVNQEGESFCTTDPEWLWTIQDGGPGHIDPGTGAYTAPALDQAQVVKLKVQFRPYPKLVGEATVLVLPFQPFDTIHKVLGPDWLLPYSDRLPFLDLDSGKRPPGSGRIPCLRIGGMAREHLMGVGIPYLLRWQMEPGVLQLSYRLGGELVRQDVTGQDCQTITATAPVGPCSVESLEQGGTGLVSSLQETWLALRGVLPLAGNAVAEPGHQDGLDQAVRMHSPFGVAPFEEVGADGLSHTGYLVSDPGSHVIRRFSPTGDGGTPWGQPGQLGHQDAPAPGLVRRIAQALCPRGPLEPETRFHGPTFLSVRQGRAGGQVTWTCKVADSGNHVIREIHPDGWVTTLAGVPGVAGHADSWNAREALFKDPQGLAEGADGILYVADRGNRVIRRVGVRGSVVTVAGSPGEAGSQDGPGPEARFTDLRGLVYTQDGLLVVDGHALRQITLPQGEVTTVLGGVGSPGFRDVRAGSPQERAQALRGPCLSSPCGLLVTHEGVVIADSGNHALRLWNSERGQLTTLVGGAGPPHGPSTVRWGLLRDDLEGPLDERYAALPAPRTVALGKKPGDLCVTSGPCLAQVLRRRGGRDSLELAGLDCLPVTAGTPSVLRFSLTSRNLNGLITSRSFQYWVEFFEPDGSLAVRYKGNGLATGSAMSVQGLRHRPGTGSAVVRCVSEQGISAGGQVAVTVK